MKQDKPHFITRHMANYRGVKLYKTIDNSWNRAEFWPLTLQRFYSTFKKVLVITSTLQKQMRNKIKGQEAGINNRMQSRNVTSRRSLWRPVTQFNTFCFFSHLTSHSLKQPISKNRLPGEQFEEHKQWCDNGRIFFVRTSRSWARSVLVYRVLLPAPRIHLFCRLHDPWKYNVFCQIFLQKGNS